MNIGCTQNESAKYLSAKMKSLLALGAFVVSTALAGAAAGQTTPPIMTEPTKVPAIYETAYIPYGFDSNDSVEVVLEGRFSSSCWRPAEIGFAVDHDKKEIHVGPAAYLYPARLCAQMTLPFDRVVNFGILKTGKYKLFQATNGAALGEIDVAQAQTERPDDYMYAPVSQAFFVKNGTDGDLTISGSFPNSCMMMDDVMFNVQPKVLVVQPIAKIDKMVGCKDGSFPFETKVKIPNIPAGRYLLHIRSMNAKSVNSLVDM